MKKARPKKRPLLTEDMTHFEKQRAVKHDGKRIYSSMTEAREAAKKFRKKFGPKTEPYACKYGENGQGIHYHNGHGGRVKRLAKIKRIVVEYKEDE